MKKIVIADKSKQDFDPANPEPEFDPSKESKEAYTTVPSEIQALSPEQQHHITKTSAKLVGKEMKEAIAYLAGKKEEKINNPDYKFYVLNKDNTKIHSGWEYKEDALDAKKDCPDSTGKIYQLAGLKKLGIDPNVDSFWAVGDTCASTKTAAERIDVKCTYEDGNEIITGFNGTLEEAKKYFLGQYFNFGDTDEHPKDKMVKCVKVEEVKGETAAELPEEEEEEATPSLKEEMMNFLKKQYDGMLEPGWEYDAEVAIYYFANDYHSGQASELYSILSTSDFRPGRNSTLEDEGDSAQMMYADLESEFADKV
jgi:hypothetical protein